MAAILSWPQCVDTGGRGALVIYSKWRNARITNNQYLSNTFILHRHTGSIDYRGQIAKHPAGHGN